MRWPQHSCPTPCIYIPVLTKVGMIEIGPIEIIECVQYRTVNEPITVHSKCKFFTWKYDYCCPHLLCCTVIVLGVLGHGDQH